MTVIYDAGVLIAAERDDRRVWAEHRARLEAGALPRTTAPVVAQVARSPRQAQLHRFLRGCEVVPFASGDGQAVGHLAGRAGVADVVDAHLVHVATSHGVDILTADITDLARLVQHAPGDVRLVALQP